MIGDRAERIFQGMVKLPTDLQILEDIYREYYPVFASFTKDTPERSTKVFVPIDIRKIAARYKIDPDIVFGRLYYHLNQKHRYTQPDGGKVEFFKVQIEDDRHAVQFPLLATVLAQLREERVKHLHAVVLSIAALSISLLSLLVSIFSKHFH